jgi:hypothetical protein
MGDELDVTDATYAMKQAGDRVRALEVALAVAIQKDEAALADLLHATRQASIEADDEANAAFKESVLELEALLCGEVKRGVDKVAAARLAVKDRSEGDSSVASALIDCSALIPEGRTYVKNIDEEKRPLSSWVDAVTYAMTYRRKGG